MTRETKLGLVVATSFLSLVTVVAYNAWTKTEDPPQAPDTPAPTSTAVAQASPKTGTTPGPEIKRTAPGDPMGSKGTASGPALSELQHLPGESQNLANGPASPSAPILPKDPHKLGQESGSTAPDLQLSGLQVIGNSGGVKLPAPPILGEKTTQQNVLDPLAASKPKTIEIPPYNGDLQQVNGGQVKGSAAGNGGGQPPPTNQQDLTGKGPAAPSSPPGVSDLAGNGGAPMPAGPIPAGVNQKSPQLNSNGTPANPTTPPAPLPTNPITQPLTANQPPADPTPLAWGIGGANLLDPKQPAQGAFPARTRQTQELTGQHSIAIPPSPVPAGPVTPPVVGTKPQVEQYDERKYVCQASDTDFKAVSKQVYNSDKYAQALMEYNRDHFLGKAAVQPTGRLQTGAAVYIPPVHILEAQYGGAISAQAPLADASKGPAAGPAAPPKALVQVPLGPATGSPVPPPAPSMSVVTNPFPQPPPGPAPVSQAAAPTPGPAPNPGPIKVYTVPQGGQQFYEIARDTLGNGLRWNEIYQLNQQYDPKFAVPAGTQLRVPPEAHIGQ